MVQYALTVVNLSRYHSNMGTRKVEQGQIGMNVAAQVRRVREQRGWSLRELSEQMGAVGRPVQASGLAKVEAGDRRVDVDDLAALATALDVEVHRLLWPDGGPIEPSIADVRKNREALRPLLAAGRRARARGVPTAVQIAALELDDMLGRTAVTATVTGNAQVTRTGTAGADPTAGHPGQATTDGDDDGER